MTRVVHVTVTWWPPLVVFGHAVYVIIYIPNFGKFQWLKFFSRFIRLQKFVFAIWAEGTDVTNVNIFVLSHVHLNMTVNIDAWVDPKSCGCEWYHVSSDGTGQIWPDLTGFVAFLLGIFSECFFITIKGVFHIWP